MCKFRRVVGRPLGNELEWWSGPYRRADEQLFDGAGRRLRSWRELGVRGRARGARGGGGRDGRGGRRQGAGARGGVGNGVGLLRLGGGDGPRGAEGRVAA